MDRALDRFEAQTLALAGVVQAVHQALLVARRGEAEPEPRDASLASILRLSVDSPDAVYGGLGGVRSGLRLLVSQLRGEQRDADLLRVAGTVLQVERRYSRHDAMQGELRRRLLTLANLHGPDDASSPEAVAGLAAAYLATISTLTPRVKIPGNPLILKEPSNIAQIRACLLAALRSASLWRQLGGKGWHLILRRGRLVETAQRLLGRSLATVQ
jgi:high frequency lysogenization protein